MQVSARILGRDYGLNSQEMNRVLAKEGILKGQPGNYSLTEKGMNFAKEHDFHRGTGGYSHYNRYWETRTFDDSIKKLLNVTPELKEEVRSEIAAERAARYAAQAAARAQADAEFLANQAKKKAAELAAEEAEEFMRKCKKAEIAGLIIIGVVGIGYGVYKIAPKAKKWWKARKEHNEGALDRMEGKICTAFSKEPVEDSASHSTEEKAVAEKVVS